VTSPVQVIYIVLLFVLSGALVFQSRISMRMRHLFKHTPIILSRLELPQDIDLREVLENPRLFYFCLTLVGTLLRILIALVLLVVLDLEAGLLKPLLACTLATLLAIGPLLAARIGYRATGGLGRAAARTVQLIGRIVRVFPGRTLSQDADRPDELEGEILTRVDGQEVFDEDERRTLSGLLALKRTTVQQVMVPERDIVVVDSSWSVARAARIVRDSAHTRLPVSDRRREDIIGFVHTRDLALMLHGNQGGALVKSIMRDVTYVPVSQPLDSLLLEFQSRRIHMAVVQDEYGRTRGLITMDDILDAAFGQEEPQE